jgi:hypothetical protein
MKDGGYSLRKFKRIYKREMEENPHKYLILNNKKGKTTIETTSEVKDDEDESIEAKTEEKGQKESLEKARKAEASSMARKANWASKNPKGIDFCLAYHLRGNCTGQCNKSHNCPVYCKDGWVCNATPDKHSPQSCPNA